MRLFLAAAVLALSLSSPVALAGSEEVNAGAHAVAGANLGSRAGWRLFWGKGDTGTHLSDDENLSDAQMRDIAAKAKVSEAAFRAELPTAWQSWFDGLTSARKTDVRKGAAALDGLIPPP